MDVETVVHERKEKTSEDAGKHQYWLGWLQNYSKSLVQNSILLDLQVKCAMAQFYVNYLAPNRQGYWGRLTCYVKTQKFQIELSQS